MKASDVGDRELLAAVERHGASASRWAHRQDVTEDLGYPWKVVLAKFRRLQRRGLLDGCGCGCRGDWHLTAAGAAALHEGV